MTFARFMELALYEREHGYYSTRADRGSRTGDFLTAPEIHPIFGWTLAVQAAEMWERAGRPAEFVLREYGAGSGALAEALLTGLQDRFPEVYKRVLYEPIEVLPARLATVARRLEAAGHADRVVSEPAGPAVGCVLANEFLDALPVHRVALRDGRLVELLVDWRNGTFEELAREPSSGKLTRRLADDEVQLGEGQEAEICLELDGWVAEVSARLIRGYVLVIDYGHPASELYGARRMRGSLLAYRRHQLADDPLAAVGEQDLTAHVDLTALERAAEREGLAVLGRTSQAEFIAGLGAGELLASLGRHATTRPEDYLTARSAVARLLDPRLLGGFAVVVLGRGVPTEPPLRGLGFRMERPAP